MYGVACKLMLSILSSLLKLVNDVRGLLFWKGVIFKSAKKERPKLWLDVVTKL